MGKTLFFRSGSQPLILSEEQRAERKRARQEEMSSSSGLGTYLERLIPGLKHRGNYNPKDTQDEAAAIIPSDLDRDCAICMDRLRDCLFRPCNHMVTCLECGQMLQARQDACPVCRKDIEQTIRVFHN
ncbi:E3 ubiquitin-protein ligase rififylin [Aplysia californica]|uniref:E3 ubiquitin-protein ligase rififylin n=1 Tax=Aplysia californica TaxID=6500 RepID=A0ABM0KAJ3_APLCA|nr:E3 ubiquitin-protein ligase rififylin [Aplysia californica]